MEEAAGPSVYGSFRIGVQSSDSNINVNQFGSRWGIMGEHEAGEGLAAVYRFETGVNDAATLTPRLHYVGVSGSFGSITVGRINSAGYVAVGSILDKAWWYGSGGVASSRLVDAVSYSFTNDLMTMQIDASYDNPAAEATADLADGTTIAAQNAIRNGENLQQVEFGLRVNVGDLGQVGLAYVDDKYSLYDDGDLMQADGSTAAAGDSRWRTKTTVVAAQVSVSDINVSVGSSKTKYTNTSGSDAAGSGNLAVRPEAKTTHLGVSGGIGETGVSYAFQWRDVKMTDTNPWLISLTKSLGGSASLVFEHADNDDATPDQTLLGLVVNF